MFDSGYKSKYIGGEKEKFVRLEDMNNSPLPMSANEYGKKLQLPGRGKKKTSKSFRLGVLKGSDGLKTFGRSLRTGVTKAVFPEDLKVSEKGIFDPQSKTLMYYNRMFELICIFSVSIDPLFFYVPIFNHSSYCIAIDTNLAKIAVLLRSVCDCLFLFRIAIQFRTAFIAPSSRVFGRGELVIDPAQIANRYLRRFFIVDLISVLPLPQALVWRFINKTKGSEVYVTKQALLNVVILQYIPRFARFVPIFSDLKKAAGSVSSNALIGAAYYILWFMICSHVTGSIWYLLAVERNETCWRNACRQTPGCFGYFLYCGNKHIRGYQQWKNVSQDVLSKSCDVVDEESEFNYGIYKKAIGSKIVTIDTFIKKLCFCMWWGLQNLSTLGQGLYTSTYPGEILFSIIISIAGLTLFALLIGNVQMYLQSITIRLEEMRTKRRDSEQWMHHRLLPPELRERVRRYDQYKWLETRGVDEESLVKSLPKDLRRDIKRHLCLNLVRRVPLFANMDEQLLDAVCERLKPSLYTENTYIVREGDPVDEMLFVIRGRMESVTTDGGRSGFFNRGILKESDFCGDELLTWALDLKADSNLPLSTRTVRALTEVEAFALEAEELKFVASQFWRLHSRQVQHTFRFYSQQWRTWAACFIQAAWRRYAKRRAEKWQRELEGEDEYYYNESDEDDDDDNDERALVKRSDSSNKLKTTILASRFAGNALRGHKISSPSPGSMAPIQKPPEPNFPADADV